MIITVNGKQQQIEGDSLSIAGLLAIHKIVHIDSVSVQRNGDAVELSDYKTTRVLPGDEIEFLYFLGGGACW
jgi:sulfur carrier protein